MKYKYVSAYEYFPNCRGCDGGSYAGLQFFKNLKDLLKWALDNKDSYELADIYNVNGKLTSGFLEYEISRHSCTGLTFKCKYLKLRTAQDGHGNIKWVNQNEN